MVPSGRETLEASKTVPFSAVPQYTPTTNRFRGIYLASLGNRHCIVIMPESMADVQQIENCARACRNLEGDIAEAGVYFGSSAHLIMRFFEKTGKTIHLFDTFDVMPDAGEHDMVERWEPKNDLSVEKVRLLLSDYDEQGLVKFHKGLFKDTFHEVADKKFCFVHVDCDLYEGARDACEFFFPRLVKNGIIMFHDYDVPAFPGIQKAVDEYFMFKPVLRVTNRYGSHHVVVKR